MAAPLRCVALLSMHDAIEMFLAAAAEAKQVGLSNKTELGQYWRLFADLEPTITLPAQRPVERLNRARVDLKHHGIRPTNDQLDAYLTITKDFLNDACTLCFGVPLHRVSLVGIIKNDQVRSFLASAERDLTDGRLSEALARVAKAFAGGLDTIEGLQRKGLNTVLQVLDVDFQKYDRFKTLTPNVQRFASGRLAVGWYNKIACEEPEQIQWCIDFVADFTLRVENRAADLMG